MRILLTLFLCLWVSAVAAQGFGADGFPQLTGAASSGGGGGGGGTSVAYTLPTSDVVHYISPTGVDTNNGLTPATAWRTPNHAMNCGDVIIAATGAYTGGWQDSEWGTVSNCPSTTGGIDGTGGVQFAILLCGGNVGTCTQDGNGSEAFRIATGHWSVQGWSATQNADAIGSCFSGENDSAPQNYIAFINNIATSCDLAGYSTSGGGGGARPISFDHFAAVGVVAFNAAQSINGACGSGISPIPGNADSDTQTHIYIAGYFGAYNTNISGTGQCTVGGTVASGHPHSDGNGIIFDVYGAGYTSAGFDKGVVVRDAVIWKSGNTCIQFFPTGNGTTNDKAQYNVRNVSCYANNQDPLGACQGDVWFHGVYPTGVGSYLLTNNLFVGNQRSCGGAGIFNIPGVAQVEGHQNTPLNASKINVSGNYIWQSAGTTTNVVGEPNTYVIDHDVGGGAIFGAPWVFGTNTYANPGFTNPNALFSTSPNCTAYTDVTSCMNDVAGLAVYTKIKPTVASTTMGYQPPAPCGPDPLFPTWLKGIVYLRWNSTTSTITMNSGLVTKPCNI